MNDYLKTILLFTAIMLTNSLFIEGELQAQPNGQQQDVTTYYYADGNKIPVTLLYNRVSVRSVNRAIHDYSRNDFTALINDLKQLSSFKNITEESIEFRGLDLLILPLETENLKAYHLALKELETLSDLRPEGVVITTNSTDDIAVVVNRIYAVFKENTSLHDRRNILTKLNLTSINQNKWGTITFKINSLDSDPVNALKSVFAKANALYESTLVEYAEPAINGKFSLVGAH